MSLTVGDSIVPSSVGGVFLPARVQSTSEYRRFCQRLDTSGVIQVRSLQTAQACVIGNAAKVAVPLIDVHDVAILTL